MTPAEASKYRRQFHCEPPPGCLPPPLLPENEDSFRLYNLIAGQVRVAGLGVVIGLDLGAIAQVFSALRVVDIEAEMEKMVMIHNAFHQNSK